MMRLILIFCLLTLKMAQASEPLQLIDPKELEKLQLETEDAASKLSGGLVQHTKDKQVEKLIQNASGFESCQKKFKTQFSSTSGSPPDINKIAECQNLIPKGDELKSVAEKLHVYVDGHDFKKDFNHKLIHNYLSDRLGKVLYGEDDPKNNKLKIVDHTTFYRLYENQIGKSFLIDVSGYCIDDYAQERGQETKSVSVSQSTINQEKDGLKNFYSADPDSLGKEFQRCLQTLPCHCYGADACTKVNDTQSTKLQAKACVLVTRLKQMRIQLKEIDEIKKNFAKLGMGQLNASNAEIYRENENGKTLDDLSGITTSELADINNKLRDEKSKYDASATEALKCKNTDCQEVLGNTREEALAEANLEYQMKSKILENRLSNIKSEDEMRKYLEQMKLTKEEIDKKIGNDYTVIHKEMLDQLKIERENIIKQINDQIAEDSIITKGDNQQATVVNQAKISDIREKAIATEERMKRIVHYSNVVSAYLAIEDSSGNKSYYTKSLERELASEVTTKDQAYFKNLQNIQTKQNQQGKKSDSSVFSVETINSFLGE